jgi:hypothetical protein
VSKNLVCIFCLNFALLANASIVNPLSSSVELSVLAVNVTDSDTASQTTTTNNLSASVSAVYNDIGVVNAHGTMSSTWNTSDQGSVSFTNYGMTNSGSASGSVSFSYEDRGGGDYRINVPVDNGGWKYRFQTNQNAVFKLQHSFISGDPYRNSHWFFVNGTSTYNFFDDDRVLDSVAQDFTTLIATDGYIEVLLNANTEYEMRIFNPLSVSGPVGTLDEKFAANFDWSIEAIPEPTIVGLLLLGILGLVHGKRRMAMKNG